MTLKIFDIVEGFFNRTAKSLSEEKESSSRALWESLAIRYMPRLRLGELHRDKHQEGYIMLKNILVPIDGSETADRAVTEAIRLAEPCGAKINFLYVANINQLAVNALLSDAVLEAVTKAGEVVLERAASMVPSGIEKESFSETGSPAVVILDFAKSNDMDLIIMGSRGLGVVKGVLLGSVSQYVVEQSECPVLVVK